MNKYRINPSRFLQDIASESYKNYLADMEQINALASPTEELLQKAIKDAIHTIMLWGIDIESHVNSVFKQQIDNMATFEQDYLLQKMAKTFTTTGKIYYLKISTRRKISVLKELYNDFNRFVNSTEKIDYVFSLPELLSSFSEDKMKSYHEVFSDIIASLEERYPCFFSNELIEHKQDSCH